MAQQNTHHTEAGGAMKQPPSRHPSPRNTSLLTCVDTCPLQRLRHRLHFSYYSSFYANFSKESAESAILTSACATGRESWRTSYGLLEKISHIKGFPLLFLNSFIFPSSPWVDYQFSLLQLGSHLKFWQFWQVPESMHALLVRRGRGGCALPHPTAAWPPPCCCSLHRALQRAEGPYQQLLLAHRLREAAGAQSSKAFRLCS